MRHALPESPSASARRGRQQKTAQRRALFSGDWLASSVGPERGTEMPIEDGFYIVTVIDNPHGYKSGVVEVRTHQNNGKPWPWAYRVPERMNHKTHGNPLKFWTGCEWRGPLTMLHANNVI